MGNILSCLIDRYDKIYKLCLILKKHLMPSTIQKHFRDAVDAISALMFFPEQRDPQVTCEEEFYPLLKAGSNMWLRYINDGWMAAEIVKMTSQNKNETNRIVLLFRRCMNRGRYDLIKQLAHLNVFFYRSFITAVGTSGEPEDDCYYTKDIHPALANTRAMMLFSNLSSATITIRNRPTGECSHRPCNLFRHRRSLLDISDFLHCVGRVKIVDGEAFGNDLKEAVYCIKNGRAVDNFKESLTKYIKKTFEIIKHRTETSRTPRSLHQLSMEYVHHKLVGPQASIVDRVSAYSFLGIYPIFIWQLLTYENLFCHLVLLDHDPMTYEDVCQIFEECKNQPKLLRDQTILINHPDLEDAARVDVYNNVFVQSRSFVLS